MPPDQEVSFRCLKWSLAFAEDFCECSVMENTFPYRTGLVSLYGKNFPFISPFYIYWDHFIFYYVYEEAKLALQIVN